jgi:hypothetical protein
MTDRANPAAWWTALTGFTALIVAIVCGVILWTFMPPVVAFPLFALAAWTLVVTGPIWLLLSLIGWFKYRALRWSAIAPGVVLVTLMLVALSAPSLVAFAISKDSLAAAARECPKSLTDRRIGAYKVWQIQPVDNGCLFFIEGGLIDSIGLAYLPNGAPYIGDPRRDGDIGYQEYHGDWYQFVQRF